MDTVDKHLLDVGSQALKKAALNIDAKEFVLSNPVLFQTFKKAANRYIGGETLDETVIKVKAQNKEQYKCSIEFMGENTLTSQEANAATDEFVKICQTIKEMSLNSTVSLDLSHIGLAISKNSCKENLERICIESAKADIEVTISAEGVDRTDDVIAIYKDTAKKYTNLSITLQAYLKRSQDDFKELIKETGRIRIVKGAYVTPAGVSYTRGDELDEMYLYYVDKLLSGNHKCSIATHHDKIQQEAKKLIQKYNTPKELYEFESLFGIRNDQLEQLKADGHPSKVYFVYGKQWYLYVCNRIAEYPLSIFQALKDIVE